MCLCVYLCTSENFHLFVFVEGGGLYDSVAVCMISGVFATEEVLQRILEQVRAFMCVRACGRTGGLLVTAFQQGIFHGER